jgi:UDP-N-acetylmuramoyl-tripeptide--D-alanyl-D-alanine ligase
MNIDVRFSELSALEKDAAFTVDAVIRNLSTDTRTLKMGDTYLAIKGEHFDGHDFVEKAIASGAASLVVSSSVNAQIPSIRVRDTILSLGNIAKLYRNRLTAKVIGITGSNGKTTVKEMVACICRECGQVTATLANNNNKIGAPLTLLSASVEDEFVVVEMGTSEQGEIAYLSDIVEPDISVVTTISESHLSGIGSRDDVFEEKSSIIAATRDSGFVVINNDGEYAQRLADKVAGSSVITYGLNAGADVTGQYDVLESGLNVTAQTPVGKLVYHLSVPGRHNVSNSLAAIAIACALDIDAKLIIQGLEKFRGTKGRLQVSKLSEGISLIDDTYNANPASTAAALEVLSKRPGRKIFVFAGMAELGEKEEELHKMIGSLASEYQVDAMFVYDDLALPTYEAFAGEKYHYGSVEDLYSSLSNFVKAGDTILVKASRRFQLDRVSQHLKEEFA